MGLDVALVHRLGVKFPLHHYVRLLEPQRRVPGPELEPVRDVASLPLGKVAESSPGPEAGVEQGQQPVMEYRRVVLHCFVGIEHRRQYLVVHVDKR